MAVVSDKLKSEKQCNTIKEKEKKEYFLFATYIQKNK